MSSYTSATDADRGEMLAAIGVDSIEALFAEIPASLRLGRPLALDPGRSEQEVYDELRALAARNVSTEDEVSFLGAGMYDHYIPALVDSIILRSEFLTPYTPYQPEISQGGLQAMFEYQTAISELTGLPVSNASVYEGPSAVAAAGYVAKLTNGRGRFVVSRGVHPHSRETLATLSHGWGMGIDEVPLSGGATQLPALGRRQRGDRPAAELPRRGRGPRVDRRRRARCGRAVDLRVRPAPARAAQIARRVRRRHRRRRGPDARQPAGLRRPVVRLLRRHRGAAAPGPGPDRR